MKSIKSFCNHLERPCAFALHSPPTKINIKYRMPRRIMKYNKYLSYSPSNPWHSNNLPFS